MNEFLVVTRKDGGESSLATVVDAAKHLNVPVSSLAYYILRGDLKRVHIGPYKLVDVVEAQAVLKRAGYRRRSKVAA